MAHKIMASWLELVPDLDDSDLGGVARDDRGCDEGRLHVVGEVDEVHHGRQALVGALRHEAMRGREIATVEVQQIVLRAVGQAEGKGGPAWVVEFCVVS
jgi:hypothetical protein